MENNNMVMPLSQILAMEAMARQKWLGQQSPDQRKVIEQAIAKRKKEIHNRKWELEQKKREVHSVLQGSKKAMKNISEAMRLVQEELSDRFHAIYANPQQAFQTVWAAAGADLQGTQDKIKAHPELFGDLCRVKALGMPVPVYTPAINAAKKFDFTRLWQLYNHIAQVKTYLEWKMKENNHG